MPGQHDRSASMRSSSESAGADEQQLLPVRRSARVRGDAHGGGRSYPAAARRGGTAPRDEAAFARRASPASSPARAALRLRPRGPTPGRPGRCDSDNCEEDDVRPWSRPLRGRIDELTIASRALVGNLPGDPSDRPIWVYLPPGYDAEPGRRYPSIYLIQGMTGQIDMWRNRAAFRPTTPENIDALFAGEGPGEGAPPPAIVVFVDCWTSYGGSQYLDSPATGAYHTYLCEEVVPFVDARYRTLADRDHRGITGKSSGGYGAMITPMLRPDLFGGLATHSGDALFEVCYGPMFAEAARALRDDYDGSIERWLADFRSRPAFTRKARRVARRGARVFGLLLGRPGRHDPPPVRSGDGRADPGDLGPLAAPGSGADGPDARGRGRAALDAGDLHRRGRPGRVLPRPGRRGISPGVRRGREPRSPSSRSSRPKHGAIEYRYPIAIRYLAERLSV